MSFRAYRIFEENGSVSARFVQLDITDLDPGEVLIRVHYSGLNFKDALAATGAGKIIRRFPCVGGIDASGIVESSADARFNPGDAVLVTGYDMGVAHDGGFAEFLRVPADWVVPLPAGLSLFDAMALGTAGFTAALAIHRLEQNELSPERGKVIVTGASGGVSGLAIQMLNQLGYFVVALTSREGQADYLKSLGAQDVLLLSDIDLGSTRPLEKGLWAGALDAAGGSVLGWLTRSMQQNGVIASFGNTAGAVVETTVFPFILRGVRLLGVDSAATPMPLRRQLWQRLAGELFPKRLGLVTHEADWAQLPPLLQAMVQHRSSGRTVLRLPGAAQASATRQQRE
jgi:putative YhdH/YhfP family quinone oxidoreductase